MKKKLLLIISIATLIIFAFVVNANLSTPSEVENLREKHAFYLDNSPYNETKNLSRKERKALGLPPNAYSERDWELTMDPNTGRPHPEKMRELQHELNSQFNRVPGDNVNSWVERGPNDVGGRTRAIMYDPNDVSNTRVFAGGVSGGLWVIDDISDNTAAWTEVNIPNNLAISSITYDPNNMIVIYAGTGESYVGGDVNGDGLWKSTDGGLNWSQIFGGITGETMFQGSVNLTVNSPGSIAGLYGAMLASFGGNLAAPITGDVIMVDDGSDPTNDACEALLNGGDLAGNIALIYRGTCEFGFKALAAQNAGAIGVIVVNEAEGAPIAMGPGADGAGVTIPAIMLQKKDGDAVIAELGTGVNVTMELSGNTFSGTNTPGISHINDVRVRDVAGNSEIYVAVASAFYGKGSSYFGAESYGMYSSTDDGANWTKISLPLNSVGSEYEPNDIEIGADNTIFFASSSNPFGEGGGAILSSTDGITFTKITEVANAQRTEIAVSSTEAETMYVLARTSGGAKPIYMAKTTNLFGRFGTTVITPPVDPDSREICVDDFTCSQSWYDLMIELDPANDAILYVGGINLYRTADSGTNWDQISQAYDAVGVSPVHPDQHAMTFHPTDSNIAVFGNDGGVYFGSTLSGAVAGESGSGSAITSREDNYNTVQFYKGAIGQEVGNEKLLAGSQDNSSLLINNATAGINGSKVVVGGDGMFCFIDRDNEYMIASSQNGNFDYLEYDTGNFGYTIDGTSSGGQFVTPGALDSANNILYADGFDGSNYDIFRYILGTDSAAKTTISNALLSRQAQAFKTSTFTTTTLFVGTSLGQLLKVTNANDDGTIAWEEITGPAFAGSISCIELGDTEDDIYVTFYNYGITSIFYTNDGGTTWQNKEGNLPDMPVRAILQNPLNVDEVIIGTELGVWASVNFTDSSPNWHQAQNGMKNVKVTSFDLRTADNMVLASTYGRGMFTGQFTADDSPLSVDQFAKTELIKIYPTISDGTFTVAPSPEIREGIIAIYDINGRQVHNSTLDFETGSRQMNLNLSSGIYIAKFTANEIQSSHKIIIE